jgi:hypothetical protein
MARMAGLLAAAILALLLAGCADTADDPLPAACLDVPAKFVAALERAPGAVRLADGTRLSTCVSRAHDGSELQSLGLALTGAADTLRARLATDPAPAATALGYLVGAVRTGVSANEGLASELARRVERAATLADDAPAAAVAAHASGLRAGASSG